MGKTIGELLDEARKKSGAANLLGHDIMALERFDPNTRHMVIFDVLTNDGPVGYKGERHRLFLTQKGYENALAAEKRGETKIINHAKVANGHLHYDHKDWVL